MGCDTSRLSRERRALLYHAVPQRQNARQFRATYARFKYCYILHYYDSDGRIVLVLNRTFYMPRAFPACRGFHFSTRIMQNAPGKSRRACIPLRHTRVTVWYYEILLGKTRKTPVVCESLGVNWCTTSLWFRKKKPWNHNYSVSLVNELS